MQFLRVECVYTYYIVFVRDVKEIPFATHDCAYLCRENVARH